MSGVILPPQYALIAWCSAKKGTGTALPLPFTFTTCSRCYLGLCTFIYGDDPARKLSDAILY